MGLLWVFWFPPPSKTFIGQFLVSAPDQDAGLDQERQLLIAPNNKDNCMSDNRVDLDVYLYLYMLIIEL